MSDKNRYIHWISPLRLGSEHDFTIFKKEAQHLPFDEKTLHVDLGFQGIAKIVSEKTNLKIPHKKPHKRELTDKQKEENSILSRLRIPVEHTIAMLKRYFILRIENRMHSTIKLDNCVEVCAMLWNFKINCKLLNIKI